jgi:hypothetical protein
MTFSRVRAGILDTAVLVNLHLLPVMTMQQRKQAPYQPLTEGRVSA